MPRRQPRRVRPRYRGGESCRRYPGRCPDGTRPRRQAPRRSSRSSALRTGSPRPATGVQNREAAPAWSSRGPARWSGRRFPRPSPECPWLAAASRLRQSRVPALNDKRFAVIRHRDRALVPQTSERVRTSHFLLENSLSRKGKAYAHPQGDGEDDVIRDQVPDRQNQTEAGERSPRQPNRYQGGKHGETECRRPERKSPLCRQVEDQDAECNGENKMKQDSGHCPRPEMKARDAGTSQYMSADHVEYTIGRRVAASQPNQRTGGRGGGDGSRKQA